MEQREERRMPPKSLQAIKFLSTSYSVEVISRYQNALKIMCDVILCPFKLFFKLGLVNNLLFRVHDKCHYCSLS